MARYYSRMGRLEEKRNRRRAVVYFGATIIVVVGLVIAGFPLLTRFFNFMGDMKSKSNPTSEKTDFIPPGPPQLAVPFEATNSATFAIKGIGEPGTIVYLSQNDTETMETEVPEDGIFEFLDIKLDLGSNVFAAVAVDEAGNKSQISSRVTVDFSTTPPKLELTTPTDRQVFSGSDSRVNIKGMTDPGVRVTINDRIVIVGSDGSFQTQISLSSGENTVVLVATDSAGNKERKEISLTYHP